MFLLLVGMLLLAVVPGVLAEEETLIARAVVRNEPQDTDGDFRLEWVTARIRLYESGVATGSFMIEDFNDGRTTIISMESGEIGQDRHGPYLALIGTAATNDGGGMDGQQMRVKIYDVEAGIPDKLIWTVDDGCVHAMALLEFYATAF